jgi:hypothetical protein
MYDGSILHSFDVFSVGRGVVTMPQIVNNVPLFASMLLGMLFAGDSASHAAAFAPQPHAAPSFLSGYTPKNRAGLRAPRRSHRVWPGLGLRMNADESGGLSDSDLSGLLARVAAAKEHVQTIPLCVLDAMLPRQRLEFATNDKSFKALLEYCKESAGGGDLGKFGMLGSPHPTSPSL